MQPPQVSTAALLGWRADARPSGREVPASADGMLPLARFVEFTEQVSRESSDLACGWSFGLNYDLTQLGPVAGALRTAPSLGQAFSLLANYFTLMQDASELTVAREEGALLLSYRILDPEIWPRHQDAIFTLGIAAQIVRMAAGTACDKIRIGVECDDAERLAVLAQRSGVHLMGGALTNWLRIPLPLADLPMPGSRPPSPDTLRTLDRLLVQKQRATSVDARVQALIFRQLGDQPICQEQIAQCLGMSSRTLRRHLARSRTSFQSLVDECRLRQAAHEFRVRRNVSIAQTALRLGYSEHSTFTRAFARWSGMPPQSFIRAHAPA
ncbi:MAG: AraC family transcriptional regulator ligand-binding domain-containing protein [Proteobacteria bacterium]|nr:AraC family transcriptional regulator ligand-binding domain-containing protein [Pseudomonadota bacterium]